MAGRPAYKPSKAHREAVYEGAKNGLNEAEIAKTIGIAYSCFKRHKGLFEAELKNGHEDGDALNIKKVENALLKRCLGFEYVETHKETTKDSDGEIINTKTKTVTKMVIPDSTSQFFYLVNRSNRWESINKAEITNSTDSANELLAKMAGTAPKSDTATDSPTG